MSYQLFDLEAHTPVSLPQGPAGYPRLVARMRDLERAAPGRFAIVRHPILVRVGGGVLEANSELSRQAYERAGVLAEGTQP